MYPSYAIAPPIGWLSPGGWSAERPPTSASPACMQRSSCSRLRRSTSPKVLILIAFSLVSSQSDVAVEDWHSERPRRLRAAYACELAKHRFWRDQQRRPI